MQTQNSKGRQIFLGTDIKNLHMQNFLILPFYRHAKFHVDTLRKSARTRPFSFSVCPTVSEHSISMPQKHANGVGVITPLHSAWSESRVRRQNVLSVAKSHYQSNRKWKYGGTLIFKLVVIDFLFDRNTHYRSICNRFHTRNYFRLRRNR